MEEDGNQKNSIKELAAGIPDVRLGLEGVKQNGKERKWLTLRESGPSQAIGLNTIHVAY